MKHSFYSLLCGALLVAGSGCSGNDSVKTAQNANEAKHDQATASTDVGKAEEKKLDFDSEFMTKAASGGLLEVEMGNMVLKNGQTPQGKQFAQQMITDHTKSNAELKALAARKSITLPTTLGDEHRKVFQDVAEEKGADIDKEYLKEMVKDHEEDVKEYTEASVKASDPDVKAFATKNVPILQHHLDMANQMKTAVDGRK